MSLLRPIAFVTLTLITCIPAWSQSWLTDNSARTPALPSLPEEGLMEPPPPLADLPPSVFDIPTQTETSQLSWYRPWTWIPWDGWESSAEVGINGATGNTEAFTIQSGARFKRKTEINMFDLRLLQNRTQAAGLVSQDNVLLYGDFDRNLGASPWSAFLKQGLEYDQLKAFDLRYFINSGAGYKWIDANGLLFSTRFGAGASREFGGPEDDWTPEALFGASYDHQVNKRNKLVARFDYFPAWEDFSDYRTITDLAWEYLLSEDSNLSLKLGALHRYESQPSGARRPSDLNYSLLLLYKF